MRKITISRMKTVALAVTAATLMMSTTVLAAPRALPLMLGVVNTIGTLTTLTGSVAEPMLLINNDDLSPAARAIAATNKSSQAAAILAANGGGGPALSLTVNADQPPMTVSEAAGKVANLDADKLDGQDATAFQQRVTGACAVGSSIRSIGADGSVTCQTANTGVAYVRTVVVSPVITNGALDAAASGTALLNALASIVDASAANPYLLQLEPGTYDLGTGSLVMKEYVDIAGAGELRTRISAAGGAGRDTGTVKGANNAELRWLSVANTGANEVATAINNTSASPRITQVTAIASGGYDENIAVYNDHASPIMTNVTATGSGGNTSFGMYSIGESRPRMTGGRAVAMHSTSASIGIYNDGGATTTIQNSVVSGTGGGEVSWAIYGGRVNVVSTQLVGGVVGTTACVGAYNANFVALSNSCQ